MPKIFDKRLADYAESLNKLIESHEELLNEYEENRAVFNARFKKVMHRKIRPVVHRLLDEASENGHWVEIHTRRKNTWPMSINVILSTGRWADARSSALWLIMTTKRSFLSSNRPGSASSRPWPCARSKPRPSIHG
jgi:hypothetical protein